MKVDWWLKYPKDSHLIIYHPSLQIALELARLNGGARIWSAEFATGLHLNIQDERTFLH